MEYNHVVSVAGLVMNEKDEVLLVRNPIRGWEYPGGIVEEGEALQSALQREIFEETGIQVSIIDLVGVNKNLTYNIVNVAFICIYESGELLTSGESLEVGWFSKQDARILVKEPFVYETLLNMLYYHGNVACWNFHKHPFQIVSKDVYPKRK